MTTTIANPTITLTSDIAGEAYLGLLDLARRTQSLVGLVWREQLKFSPSALQMVADLESSLVEERRTEEWPGTRLFGSQAWYRLYRCDEHSLPILARAGRLYGWLAPDFPEDLSCQLPTGECWLMSVAHESMGSVSVEGLDETSTLELDRVLRSASGQFSARSNG